MEINYIDSDNRLTTYPIGRPELFEHYKKASAMYWTVDEVDTSNDRLDFQARLTPDERLFVKHILAFFAASDGIVNVNLIDRFIKEIKILEVNYFYSFQVMMENVHANMYSILLDTIITEPEEKNNLLNAVKTMPIIGEISAYMFEVANSTAPLAERLLKMALVEGVLFQGCFCGIYYFGLTSRLSGLVLSNELISRDEAEHSVYPMKLIRSIIKPEFIPTQQRVNEIVREFMPLPVKFTQSAIPVGLLGLNAQLMIGYLENVADCLVAHGGFEPVYGTVHEIHFMHQINMKNRNAIFEHRSSNYTKSQPGEVTKDLTLLDDF